jgi:ATP/maltotriose-dependent transcriptional regulator MalT
MVYGGEFDLPSASRISAFACGVFALAAAEGDDVLPLLERSLDQARKYGAVSDALAGHTYRGMVWLWRGALGEALADARAALRLIEQTHYLVDLPYALAVAVTALVEQGDVDEAARMLHGVDLAGPRRSGHWFLLQESYGRLLLAQGRPQEALEAMRAAGERFARTSGRNPALCAWRSGAARCLHELGRADEARALVEEELALARQWGAARPLGHALRIAATVDGGESRLGLLDEAARVLEDSPARLELAHALVQLGAATRRADQPAQARGILSRGLDAAYQCGATPLADLARSELHAAGARPRRTAVSGPEALTPSERRVADLAATGLSNRDIAQQLFVTVKTVEVHLASTYRKLDIAGRRQLAEVLQGEHG